MMPFQRFKVEAILTKEQAATVVAAIRNTEQLTSGEIRVYLETKNKYVSPIDRAKEVFVELNMHKTKLRNGVLVYVATQHKEMCILGDSGIYQKADSSIWDETILTMQKHFKGGDFVAGLTFAVNQIGVLLQQHFPYDREIDKNELPDEIVFGK